MEARQLKNPSFEGVTPVLSTDVLSRLEDIDPNGHVNNTHFSAWAIGAVPREVRDAKQLADFFINFKAEVMPGDKITVNTYAQEGGAYWHILIREGDNKEIASVYTAWK
jgi:acyl-ACP thioesterase